MTMSSKDDLITLIDNANQAIEHPEVQRPRKGIGLNVSLLGKILILVMFPLSAITAVDEFSSDRLSQPAIMTQMIGILHTAQNSIEVIVASDGRLPPVLPNASLANVVRYDVQGNSYTLSMESHDVFVSLDSTGLVTTHIGN